MKEPDPVRSARLGLGQQLAQLRKEAGLTQHQLAPLIGYSRTTVANVEVGRQLADRAFWVRADGALESGAVLTLEYDSISAQHERLEQPDFAAGPSILQVSSVGAGEADIAAIRAVAEAFTAADRRVGGGRLYQAVAAYLETEIGPRLGQGTQGQALFAASASLASVAAWMAHDGGDNQTAQQRFRQSYRFATAAGDPTLIADICTGMAHLATQLNEPREAIRIAERGLDSLQRGPASYRLTARLHAMRARGLAVKADARSTYRALRQAEEALAWVRPDEPGEWVSHFDRGSLCAEAATCLRDINDLAGAEEHARTVISLRDGDRVRSRAFGQLSLAQTLVGLGRVDEAAKLGQDVCAAAPTLTSARVLDQLRDLGAVLGTYAGSTVVDDFHERLLHITAADTTQGKEPEWPL